MKDETGEAGLADAAAGNGELPTALAASGAPVRLKGDDDVEAAAPPGANGERTGAPGADGAAAAVEAIVCAGAGFISSPSRAGFSSAGATAAARTGAAGLDGVEDAAG